MYNLGTGAATVLVFVSVIPLCLKYSLAIIIVKIKNILRIAQIRKASLHIHTELVSFSSNKNSLQAVKGAI